MIEFIIISVLIIGLPFLVYFFTRIVASAWYVSYWKTKQIFRKEDSDGKNEDD